MERESWLPAIISQAIGSVGVDSWRAARCLPISDHRICTIADDFGNHSGEQKMKGILAVATLLSILISELAGAEALAINPGFWEFKSTSTNPLTGQTESETETECVVESELDLADLIDNQDGCEITESSLNGDTLTFSMSCKMQGGEMAMNAVYQSDGDSVDGTTKINISFGTQTMTSNGSFSGQRLGDC